MRALGTILILIAIALARSLAERFGLPIRDAAFIDGYLCAAVLAGRHPGFFAITRRSRSPSEGA